MRKLLLLTAVFTAAFAVAQDPVALKRAPKEGDSAKYKLQVDTEFGGMKIKFTANVLEKVTKVNADGSYVVSSEQSDAMLDMDGQQQPAPSEIGALVSTTYRPDGTVAEIVGDSVNGDAYRVSNMQTITWPKENVSVGSKWTQEYKADAAKGSVDGTSNYEIVGREKIGSHDCFKISFDYKEKAGSDPASAKGFSWVDVATGLMVKAEGEWTNAPIAGQMISGKVSMTLAE